MKETEDAIEAAAMTVGRSREYQPYPIHGVRGLCLYASAETRQLHLDRQWSR